MSDLSFGLRPNLRVISFLYEEHIDPMLTINGDDGRDYGFIQFGKPSHKQFFFKFADVRHGRVRT